MELTKPGLKQGAKVSLIILLLTIVLQFINFYQAKQQLTNPLIPASLILTIVQPTIFIGFISTIVSIAATLLYFFRKYLLVIILVSLTITWQQFYPYWAAQ